MRSYNSDFRKKSTITPTRSLQAPTIISRCRHALKVPSNILFRGDSGSGLICFGAASSSPHATSHHPRDVIPSRPPQGHPLSQLTALSAHGWRIASVRGPAKISCSISTHRSHPRLRTSSGVVAGASPPASTPSTSAGDGSHKPAAGPKLAFFVSGGGSNFKAIHTAILEGHFFAHVAVCVSLPKQNIQCLAHPKHPFTFVSYPPSCPQLLFLPTHPPRCRGAASGRCERCAHMPRTALRSVSGYPHTYLPRVKERGV